jgi:hypothetical protein
VLHSCGVPGWSQRSPNFAGISTANPRLIRTWGSTSVFRPRYYLSLFPCLDGPMQNWAEFNLHHCFSPHGVLTVISTKYCCRHQLLSSYNRNVASKICTGIVTYSSSVNHSDTGCSSAQTMLTRFRGILAVLMRQLWAHHPSLPSTQSRLAPPGDVF